MKKITHDPAPTSTHPAPAHAASVKATASTMAPQAAQMGSGHLEAFIRLQEQTAALHAQFLDNQARATEQFYALLQGKDPALGAPLLGAPLPAALNTPLPSMPQSIPEIVTPAPVMTTTPAGHAPAALAMEIVDVPEAPSPQAALEKAPRPSSNAFGILLQVVADKTGYPEDMLDAGMSMTDDLGIDSIKRVEILSGLKDAMPELPSIEPETLAGFSTLGEIGSYLEGLGGDGESAGVGADTQAVVAAAPSEGAATDAHLTSVLMATVAEKTGYPEDMLETSMAMTDDLGIDSIKRVEILSGLKERLPELPAIEPEALAALSTLGEVAELLAKELGQGAGEAKGATAAGQSKVNMPSAQTQNDAPVMRFGLGLQPLERLEKVAKDDAKPKSVILVHPDGVHPQPLLDALVAQGIEAQTLALGAKEGESEWQEKLAAKDGVDGLLFWSLEPSAPSYQADADWLRQSFRLCRWFSTDVQKHGASGGVFWLSALVSAEALGLVTQGQNKALAVGPGRAAISGLIKSLALEWPACYGRVLGIANAALVQSDAETVSRHLWQEDDLGALEMVLTQNDQGVLKPLALRLSAILDEGRGAKAISWDDKDVALVTGGARGVTLEAAHALLDAGVKHLVLVGRSALVDPADALYADVASDKGALQLAIRDHENAIQWTPKSLSDKVQGIMARRQMAANIEGLRDRGATVRYESTDLRDADAVAALFTSLDAQGLDITAVVHGAGVLADGPIEKKTDADFAKVFETKVNGWLNIARHLDAKRLKLVAFFSSSTARFGRKGQSDYAIANEALNHIAERAALLWPGCKVSAFGFGPWDGGMVNDGLKALFAQEKIGLITKGAGRDYLKARFPATTNAAQEVVLGAGSELPSALTMDAKATAKPSDDTDANALAEGLRAVFERRLTLDDEPYLRSHVLGGKAVLPAAMTVELLAHGALHSNPGLRFCGFRNLKIFKGVQLATGEHYDVQVRAAKLSREGDAFVVQTELSAKAGPGLAPLHARADIVLGERLPEVNGHNPKRARALGPFARAKEIYAGMLFHGPDFQGIETVDGVSAEGISATIKQSPAPSEWQQQPVRKRWVADPLALDCSFQMMSLWSMDQRKQASLPTAAGSYLQFRDRFPDNGTRIEVDIKAHDENSAAADIRWLDAKGDLVALMEDYRCVIDDSLTAAYGANRLS